MDDTLVAPMNAEELTAAALNVKKLLKKSKVTVLRFEIRNLEESVVGAKIVELYTADFIEILRNTFISWPKQWAAVAADISDPAEVSERVRHLLFADMEKLSHYEFDAEKAEMRINEGKPVITGV